MITQNLSFKTQPEHAPKAAFIVQRYGPEVAGGTELHCRLLAEHMTRHWQVTVLTSCARYLEKGFENYYQAGETIVNQVQILRFAIDRPRINEELFMQLDCKVLHPGKSRSELRKIYPPHISEMMEHCPAANEREVFEWLREMGPYCSELFEYVHNFHNYYDLFVFFGYLYTTTTFILPRVRHKSILVPTAHQEPHLYVNFYDTFFQLPAWIAFNTQTEKELVQKRSVTPLPRNRIVGLGFDPIKISASKEILKENNLQPGNYFVVVGRIQKQKGCEELLYFYLALPEKLRQKYPLAMVGQEVPSDDATKLARKSKNVHLLGYVPEDIKNAVLSHAKLLIIPSLYESLSMVLMEAWQAGIPVLVNGNCQVTRKHCARSGAGLWYKNQKEFINCLEYMLDAQNSSTLAQMGQKGRAYVQANYSWPVVEDKYIQMLNELEQTKL